MKEIIAALAEYNLNANKKMLGILEGASPQVLTKDMGSYYKTILSTVDHIFFAEVNWLKKFNAFFSYPSLAKSWLVTTDMEEIKTRAKANSKVLFSLLRDADGLFVNFAGELDEGDLETRVKFKNMKGEDMQRKYWNTIVHILNHGTHHRGEISAMLDMQGVENDYSGFNQYTR
jgi:uncharacterized damage-inducible protein DinB